MRLSVVGPLASYGPIIIDRDYERGIRWGRRLVYVLLFVAFVVAFGETDEPRTILFLVSLASLTIIALFVLRDDKWDETNTNLAKRERDYQKDIAEWEQHNAQGLGDCSS